MHYNIKLTNPNPSNFKVLKQRIDCFLSGLGDGRISDPAISTWFKISDSFCKQNNLIWHQDFPIDHPISELERLLVSVLIRHQSVGPLVLGIIDNELAGKPCDEIPKPIAEIIKKVHQSKWTLIKTRQQLNRSYKEVCAPMLDKCRFLLYEVRPAISSEQLALKRLKLLYVPFRFKSVVQRIIRELRSAKNALECAKPEDILNVSIQNKTNAGRAYCSDIMNYSWKEMQKKRTNMSENNENENVAAEDGKASYKRKVPANFPGENKMSEASALNAHHAEEFNVDEMMNLIVEFALNSPCDVETIRRAMYCQVQRYQIRKKGIQLFTNMYALSNIIDAAKYLFLSGYNGLLLQSKKLFTTSVLSDLNMITCFQKADLILEHSSIIQCAIANLKRNKYSEFAKPELKTTYKNSTNIETYAFLKKVPKVRFLINYFGILSKNMEPNEISLIINSGVVGCILSLLQQTRTDCATSITRYKCTYVNEDAVTKVEIHVSFFYYKIFINI